MFEFLSVMLPILAGPYAAEGTTVAYSLSQFLSDINSVFTQAIDWVGAVANVIAGNPFLLMAVILPVVGLGVGLFRRLLRV